VFDGKLWLIDGSRAQWSIDGFNWYTAPPDPHGVDIFGATNGRNGASVFTYARPGEAIRIWVVGGSTGQRSGTLYKDDAWSSD
jgi:hypothetical protein